MSQGREVVMRGPCSTAPRACQRPRRRAVFVSHASAKGNNPPERRKHGGEHGGIHMSMHFRQGEYDIVQDEKKVGRLIALDAPAPGAMPAEYWYLYYDILAWDPSFRTYTAPSQSL